MSPRKFRFVCLAWENRQRREDLRAALICSTLANLHGAETTPGDFLGYRRRVQSPEEMFTALSKAFQEN